MADLAYSDYISQFSPDEQPAARDAYFNKYVRPKFSKDELAAARSAFDKHAPLPDPGFFSELGKGLQRGLQTKKQGYLGTAALGATVRGDAEAINQANRDVREQAGVLRKLQSPFSDIENVHSAGDALRWGGAALGESLGQMGPTLGIGLAAGPIGAGADIVATTAGNQYAQALQRADDTTAVNQYLDNQPIDLEKSYESIDKGKLAVGTAASSALEGLGYALGPAGKLIRGTGLLGQAAKAKVLAKGAPADLLAGNVGPTSSRLTNAGIGFAKGGAGEFGTEFGQEFADEYGSGNQDWLSRDTAIQGLKSGANAFLGGGAIHGAAGAMQTPTGATSSPGDNLIRDEFYDAPPEAPVPPTPEEMRTTRIENRMADLGTLRSMAPEVFKGLKTKTNKDANPNVVVPLDQFIQHVRKNWKDSVPKVEMNDDLAAQFEEASASNPNLKLNKFVSDLQASLEKQYAKDNPPPTDGEIAKAHALYRELHKAGIRGYGTAEKAIAGDVDLANIEPPVGPVSEGLPSGVGEKNPTVMRNDIQYDGLPAGVAWSNSGPPVADVPDAEAPITEVAPPVEPQSVRELADVVAESTAAGNKGNLAKLRGMSKNFWSALEAEDTDPLAVIDANLEETQANTKIKPETAQLRIDFLNNLKEGVQQWQSQRNPAPAEDVNADESAGDLNAENPVITSPPDVGPAKARNRKKPKRAKAQSEAIPAAEGSGVVDAPVEVPKPDRVYLNVPYHHKDRAKKNGAKWDSDKKMWYAAPRDDGSVFINLQHWVPGPVGVTGNLKAAAARAANLEATTGRPVEIHVTKDPAHDIWGYYLANPDGSSAEEVDYVGDWERHGKALQNPQDSKILTANAPDVETGDADAYDTEGSIGADVPAVTGGAPGVAGGELGAVGAVDGLAGRPAGGGTDAVAGASDPGNQPTGAAGVATESAPALDTSKHLPHLPKEVRTTLESAAPDISEGDVDGQTWRVESRDVTVNVPAVALKGLGRALRESGWTSRDTGPEMIYNLDVSGNGTETYTIRKPTSASGAGTIRVQHMRQGPKAKAPDTQKASAEETGPKPLAYDPATNRHSGQKLQRGMTLWDADGQAYRLDRDGGFMLTVDKLDEQGQSTDIVSYSVDSTDKTRYKPLFTSNPKGQESQTGKKSAKVPSWEKPESLVRRMGPAPSWEKPTTGKTLTKAEDKPPTPDEAKALNGVVSTAPPSQRADLSPEEIETLRSQAKAAYTAGDLEIPQYSAVLDFMAKKQWDSVRTILAKLGYTPTTTDKGSLSKVKRAVARGGADIKRLINMLGGQMYKAQLADVTVKEMVQNSFDAVKASVNKKLEKVGKIDVAIDPGNRLVVIRDNGQGMTPAIIQKAFLTLAGTDKSGLNAGEASGGFGMAKAAFLTGSDQIWVRTARDGKQTTFTFKGAGFFEEDIQLDTQDVDKKAHGTTIIVKIPENTKVDGQDYTQWFPYDKSDIEFFKNPMLGNDMEVNFGKFRLWEADPSSLLDPDSAESRLLDDSLETQDLGKNFDLSGYGDPIKATFPWGTADVYFGKKRKTGGWLNRPKHAILSAGIFQFNTNFAEGFEQLPYDIIVNAKPTVAPDSPSYPFNLKREGWKDVIEKDVAALNKYLSNIASGKSAEETVETFKNIRALPRIDVEGSSVGNDVDITEFILQKPKPPVSEAEIEGVLEDQESSAPSEITVGNGLVTTTDKEGKEKTLVDLEQERARKKDKYTSSLETDAPVPKASDFLLDVGIDDKLPIFHNNTGADYSAMSPQADVLFAEIGSLMLTMKDKIASFGRRGYESLKGDQPYFVGVSIDKQYHGVSLVVPFRAALLNPLAIKGKTLPSIVVGLYNTLVHEFAHTRERNHDAAFIGEMASLESLLASDGFDIEMRVQLTRILKKHQQVFNDLRDKFEDSTTTNLSKSLHEGEENGGLASARDEDALSAGRPAVETRDTSDAVNGGGGRQNGGTVRGNAGGGQQGQDRGGRVPSGAGAVARKVTDAVKDAYGDTLPRSAALVLNPQQLATLNPGLSAAQTYATLIDRMQSMTTQKQQRFKNIVEDIDALPRQVKSELLGVMTESTLADAHPDEAITLSGKNAHLVNNKEAEHLHKLVQARYQALPDNAKKIFKAARDEFAASWTERFDAMRDLVNSFDISERARKKFIAELDRLSNHVKGPYFPLFREGRYSVVWESPAYTAAKESEDHAAMAAMKSVRRSPDFWFRKTDSLEEAKRLASNPPEGMAEGSRGDYNVSDENDVLTQGVTNDFLNQALGEIDKRLAGVDGADEAKQALRETFIRAMPDMSVMKRTLARRNVSGVRADDMLRAIAKAGSADAFYLARIKYAEKVVQSLQALKQQDSKLKHVYGSMLANYRANMVRPDENIFDTTANNLTTWQYYRTLVASPSFIITNSAQPWMVTTPVMAPRFGLGSTIGEMNKALAIGAKVAGATKLGKPSNWSKHEVYTDEMPDPKQPGISNAEASRRQRERQALADLMHRIEISQARELANIGKLGSSTLSKFLRIAATPAHIIETTNRVGTGLAAYRLEFRRLVEDKTRSQRLQDAHRRDYPGTPDLTSEQIQAINHRDAVAYADQMIRETQVDMTPAGMPTIMKKFNRGAMRLLFQFKRYQQAMLFLYARLAADVYRSGDKQAGQALMGLTITHALAAGVKGAALYGLVVKPLGMMGLALKDALDDDEDDDTTFDQYIDALMLKLADGDVKLAQLLRLGLPAYNGVDLSRKVGHGDLFPLLGLPEGDNGDTFEEKLGSYLSDLLPALSSVKSAHDAWHAYQRTGSATDAFNAFGLKPFSDVTRAMSLAEHGMMNRDQTYPYIKADQYSGADLLFKALGFQPTLETEHYRALQAKSSTEDSAKEQKSRLVSAWVRAKRNGDSAALGKVQSDIDAFNQRMPKEMKEFRITVDDRLRALQSAKRKGKQVDELGLSRPRRGGKWIDERTAPYGARE